MSATMPYSFPKPVPPTSTSAVNIQIFASNPEAQQPNNVLNTMMQQPVAQTPATTVLPSSFNPYTDLYSQYQQALAEREQAAKATDQYMKNLAIAQATMATPSPAYMPPVNPMAMQPGMMLMDPNQPMTAMQQAIQPGAQMAQQPYMPPVGPMAMQPGMMPPMDPNQMAAMQQAIQPAGMMPMDPNQMAAQLAMQQAIQPGAQMAQQPYMPPVGPMAMPFTQPGAA
ncbi:MAG: hypothetical protein AAGI66_06395 [Cyanobacteria bacterium P01_H01_bin.74]